MCTYSFSKYLGVPFQIVLSDVSEFPFVVSINSTSPAVEYTRKNFLHVPYQRQWPDWQCSDRCHLCFPWTPGHPCSDMRLRKLDEQEPLSDLFPHPYYYCGDWDEEDVCRMRYLCRKTAGEIDETDEYCDLRELPSAPAAASRYAFYCVRFPDMLTLENCLLQSRA